MAGKRKISAREFSRRATLAAEKYLSKLPPDERSERIRAFENTVTKLSRGNRATTGRSKETQAYPLVARGRG